MAAQTDLARAVASLKAASTSFETDLSNLLAADLDWLMRQRECAPKLSALVLKTRNKSDKSQRLQQSAASQNRKEPVRASVLLNAAAPELKNYDERENDVERINEDIKVSETGQSGRSDACNQQSLHLNSTVTTTPNSSSPMMSGSTDHNSSSTHLVLRGHAERQIPTPPSFPSMQSSEELNMYNTAKSCVEQPGQRFKIHSQIPPGDINQPNGNSNYTINEQKADGSNSMTITTCETLPKTGVPTKSKRNNRTRKRNRKQPFEPSTANATETNTLPEPALSDIDEIPASEDDNVPALPLASSNDTNMQTSSAVEGQQLDALLPNSSIEAKISSPPKENQLEITTSSETDHGQRKPTESLQSMATNETKNAFRKISSATGICSDTTSKRVTRSRHALAEKEVSHNETSSGEFEISSPIKSKPVTPKRVTRARAKKARKEEVATGSLNSCDSPIKAEKKQLMVPSDMNEPSAVKHETEKIENQISKPDYPEPESTDIRQIASTFQKNILMTATDDRDNVRPKGKNFDSSFADSEANENRTLCRAMERSLEDQEDKSQVGVASDIDKSKALASVSRKADAPLSVDAEAVEEENSCKTLATPKSEGREQHRNDKMIVPDDESPGKADMRDSMKCEGLHGPSVTSNQTDDNDEYLSLESKTPQRAFPQRSSASATVKESECIHQRNEDSAAAPAHKPANDDMESAEKISATVERLMTCSLVERQVSRESRSPFNSPEATENIISDIGACDEAGPDSKVSRGEQRGVATICIQNSSGAENVMEVASPSWILNKPTRARQIVQFEFERSPSSAGARSCSPLPVDATASMSDRSGDCKLEKQCATDEDAEIMKSSDAIQNQSKAAISVVDANSGSALPPATPSLSQRRIPVGKQTELVLLKTSRFKVDERGKVSGFATCDLNKMSSTPNLNSEDRQLRRVASGSNCQTGPRSNRLFAARDNIYTSNKKQPRFPLQSRRLPSTGNRERMANTTSEMFVLRRSQSRNQGHILGSCGNTESSLAPESEPKNNWNAISEDCCEELSYSHLQSGFKEDKPAKDEQSRDSLDKKTQSCDDIFPDSAGSNEDNVTTGFQSTCSASLQKLSLEKSVEYEEQLHGQKRPLETYKTAPGKVDKRPRIGFLEPSIEREPKSQCHKLSLSDEAREPRTAPLKNVRRPRIQLTKSALRSRIEGLRVKDETQDEILKRETDTGTTQETIGGPLDPQESEDLGINQTRSTWQNWKSSTVCSGETNLELSNIPASSTCSRSLDDSEKERTLVSTSSKKEPETESSDRRTPTRTCLDEDTGLHYSQPPIEKNVSTSHLGNLMTSITSFLPSFRPKKAETSNRKDQDKTAEMLEATRIDAERREADMVARREAIRLAKQKEAEEKQRRVEAKRQMMARAERQREEEKQRKEAERARKLREVEEQRKRQREEEEKKREQKRRRVEEQQRRLAQQEADRRKVLEDKERGQRERLQRVKGNTVPGLNIPVASGQTSQPTVGTGGDEIPHPSSKMSNFAMVEAQPQSYEMSAGKSSPDDGSSDSDSERRRRKRKKIPLWARSANLPQTLVAETRDPDTIFERVHTLNLDEVFDGQKGKKKFRARTSSGMWVRDRLTAQEELEYKKATTGFGSDAAMDKKQADG